MADDQRVPGVKLQLAQIQLDTNDKHKKDEPELAQGLRVADRRRGEEHCSGFRPQITQYRRPQKNTGDNFPDYPLLSKAGREQGKYPRNRQDDDDLQQNHAQRVCRLVPGRRCFRRSKHWRRVRVVAMLDNVPRDGGQRPYQNTIQYKTPRDSHVKVGLFRFQRPDASKPSDAPCNDPNDSQ